MTDFPTISGRGAAGLLGKTWRIAGREYRFGTELTEGNEATLFPLLDARGEHTLYLRVPKSGKMTAPRLRRTEWLVARRLDQRSGAFAAAPRAWASTAVDGRVPRVDHDFAGTLHAVVPGRSWQSIKYDIYVGEASALSLEARQAVARDFLMQLADLEWCGVVHGDLSDGNLVVDFRQGTCRLVDFDAFVCNGDPSLLHPWLSVGDGGVKGTPGYMPPDLEAQADPEASPYSDRHARDMLLIELLSFGKGDHHDRSPTHWGNQAVLRAALEPFAQGLRLEHLLREDLFTLPETQRPSSRELAEGLGWRPPVERDDAPRTLLEEAEAIWSGAVGAAVAASLLLATGVGYVAMLVRGSWLSWPCLFAMVGLVCVIVSEDVRDFTEQWRRTGYSLGWLVSKVRGGGSG
ncbi:MAG: hypothetical protein AAGA92_11635 [Planctomycetota bacterium]